MHYAAPVERPALLKRLYQARLVGYAMCFVGGAWSVAPTLAHEVASNAYR